MAVAARPAKEVFVARPGGPSLIYLSRQLCIRMGQLALLIIGLLLYSYADGSANAVGHGFALRNQNPFLQIYGLPPFQSAALAAPGELTYIVSLDIANHADAGDNELEDFVIDGETYFLTVSLRWRATSRLELGIDVPFVAHSDGFLDNAIENWHDTFGMSNTKRRGPSNQLRFSYSSAGITQFELSSPSSGIGDIQLTAAMPIGEEGDARAFSVRSSIKLPMGEASELRGSGAVDVSLGVYGKDTRTLWNRSLGLAGFAGVLLLGDGDVLADIQRSAVPFGGISANWQLTENLGVAAQLHAQGSYFDSELKELGGNTVQLAVGFDFRLPQQGLGLSFAVVEDVSANATTDFALHFSVRSVAGR